MAYYGNNAPGYTGYKREQEPYANYGNTGSYGGSRYPDQYASNPVHTTYVVEEDVRVQEIRRSTDTGYHQPGSITNVHPQKVKEYVTRVSNHPLPPSTNHNNYGHGDYSGYGSNNPVRNRGVAPLNDIRDIIEAAREPKDQFSPNSFVGAGTHHLSQGYDQGYGGLNSSTRPYGSRSLYSHRTTEY